MARLNLLIIDELGFVPLPRTGPELLFEVFSQRYERGSILVTTNMPFDEWTEVLGSDRLTGALMASTIILDKGSLTVSFQGSPSVDEGTAATFTVALSRVSDEIVTADWTTRQVSDPLDPGETDNPGDDYVAAAGTVSIPSGSTSATFTVDTTDDTLVLQLQLA